jgi:hypothetical protein
VTRIVRYLKQNAIAVVALFIALGGTSYAAVAIPKNSVGSTQLRKGAVSSSKIRSGAITPGKLASKSFGGRIFAFAEIENNGSVAVSDPKGIKTNDWNANAGGAVIFPRHIPSGCYPLTSAASTFSPTVGGPPASVGAAIQNSTLVAIAVNDPVPVTLAIICAR